METETANKNAWAETTPQALLDHLRTRLPEFAATAEPERIRTSHLNAVYRVPGQPQPLIIKLPLTHTVALPRMPLHQHWLDVEARGLAAFAPGGALESVGSEAVRPPKLFDFDEQRRILVMEDVEDAPHLGTWLLDGGADRAVGRLLGNFIATLHWESFADPELAMKIDNSAIHSSRLKLHYGAVEDICRRSDLSDAGALGRKAATQGEELQGPGVCVIHGDLWPPSILITGAGLRVIDWELTHFGHPAQDVGHLASHLWMHAHRAPTPDGVGKARATLQDFLSTYRMALGSAFDEVFGAQGVRQSALHFGVELLMRTTGSLHEGYLYEGLEPDAPALREAVQTAAHHIRSPERLDTFAALLS